MTNTTSYDIAVIGGGIVGAAIARKLAAYDMSVALIDAREDVGDGTSKANTAILHTGFDAKPGTLESRLVHEGYHLLAEYAKVTGIPVEYTGAILVAWDQEQLDALPGLKEKAEHNDYHGTYLVSPAEIYDQLPHLGKGAVGGLAVPDESIICTWTTNLAFATEAVMRGATLLLNRHVGSADVGADVTILHTSRDDVSARWVINAAGLGGDLIDQLFGYDRFEITPRRGELLVYDKQARPLVNKIVLPVPTARGKGVLVSPTIYGNVMLGPTAEDLTDRSNTSTSEAGFEFLLGKGRQLMPELLDEEVTASYAGLRAASSWPDYLIDVDAEQRYVVVGGIRSTGLTAGIAIAEYVDNLLRQGGHLTAAERANLPAPPQMPNIGDAFLRPYQDTEKIAADPAYGKIVCFCERVTAGEIRDTFSSPIPPSTLNGLRRRTRAHNGRCQGFYCGAEVAELLESRGGQRAPAAAQRSGDPTVTGPTLPSPVSRDLSTLRPTVLIIGGGPSGLRAAADLAPMVDGDVLVVEREAAAGGIPRHSDHPGYGMRDLGKFTSGPKYAKIMRRRAIKAGAKVLENAMVTDWADDRSVNVTSPTGRVTIEAQAVILATGARERPRPARLIPGDRATGVYTTGHLQNLVHLKHGQVGKKAVIVGAELVSWSAALTLRHVKCTTVLMTTQYPKPDAYFIFSRFGKAFFHTKVATRTRVVNIVGRPAVTGVEIENMDTGQRRVVDCDTVILTGDWIPDNELARAAGIDIDPGSKSPVVDAALRTSKPGVFAIGNVLHPVDTADIAALDGAAVAEHVLAYLKGTRPAEQHLQLIAEAPFRWVAPRILRQSDPAPPRGRLLLWSDEYLPFPRITLRQNGKITARKRLWWPATPGRVFRVPSNILQDVDWNAGTVTIGVSN